MLNSFENIKFLIPNAKEHGPIHLTSTFLTTYIEHWNPVKDPQKQPYHYQTRQEAIDFYDGLAIVAHPWGGAARRSRGTAAGGVPELRSLWITALVSAMYLGRRGRVFDLDAMRKQVLQKPASICQRLGLPPLGA